MVSPKDKKDGDYSLSKDPKGIQRLCEYVRGYARGSQPPPMESDEVSDTEPNKPATEASTATPVSIASGTDITRRIRRSKPPSSSSS
jgi:hypothetical protein